MHTDTLTVGYAIKTGDHPALSHRAHFTAVAAEAVTNAPYDPHAKYIAVEADSQGFDLDAVEHTRQSRLQRWQRLP